MNINFLYCLQAGVVDPPSISSITRLLRGGNRRDDPDGKKDYTISGILGGKFSCKHSKIFHRMVLWSLRFSSPLEWIKIYKIKQKRISRNLRRRRYIKKRVLHCLNCFIKRDI